MGNFVVYSDGQPVIIDVGVETYTRKTFSPQRYEIWTMQSQYHSLPTIDGVMQSPGAEFAARDVQYSADDSAARFSLDIAGAYPPEAKLKSWQRTLTLLRGQAVELEDRYELAQKPGKLTLSLMTPCRVDASQAGTLALRQAPLAGGLVSGAGKVSYDPAVFAVTHGRNPGDGWPPGRGLGRAPVPPAVHGQRSPGARLLEDHDQLAVIIIIGSVVSLHVALRSNAIQCKTPPESTLF